jgi:hypothetical protein
MKSNMEYLRAMTEILCSKSRKNSKFEYMQEKIKIAIDMLESGETERLKEHLHQIADNLGE